MSNPFGAAATVAAANAAATSKKYVPPNARQDVSGTGAASGAAATSTATETPAPTRTVMTAAARSLMLRKPVKIDSLVLIKIVKHCTDHYPVTVNGQLLGLDTEQGLEVTNCFALKNKQDLYNQFAKEDNDGVDDKVDEELSSTQLAMVELMHCLRVDCFSVGWYQTMTFDDAKVEHILESLFLYQDSVASAIVLGFDPLLSAAGRNGFRAYRLSEDFLSAHQKAGDDAHQARSYCKLKAKDVLIQVPLVVSNPAVLDVFLNEWVPPLTGGGCSIGREGQAADLELDPASYSHKALNFFSSAVDQLTAEQEQMIKYQRDSVKIKQQEQKRKFDNDDRKAKGEAPLLGDIDYRRSEAPSHLGTLLLANRATGIAAEIESVTTENLIKSFLVQQRFCGAPTSSTTSTGGGAAVTQSTSGGGQGGGE